jgi:hypothetical protein
MAVMTSARNGVAYSELAIACSFNSGKGNGNDRSWSGSEWRNTNFGGLILLASILRNAKWMRIVQNTKNLSVKSATLI